MNRKNVIIFIEKDKAPECLGNLKKLCEAKGYKYNTMSKQKMPIKLGNCTIYRVPFH
jgi:hypothetical protein